jgi:hypothetical protein
MPALRSGSGIKISLRSAQVAGVQQQGKMNGNSGNVRPHLKVQTDKQIE